MKNSDINIRDPFVLQWEGKYYLYGTRGADTWGVGTGFDVYVGDDLENWSDPIPCFENDGTFWANLNYWAPEVHVWQGKFYMFASFKSETRSRGTQILVADTPLGPFREHSDGPVTPNGWECLDGTLYVSKTGVPYIVFCHEWTQTVDGEMCALQLTDDLKSAIGKPMFLFYATDADWIVPQKHRSGAKGYVTDGPFMWRTESGRLLLLWASFSAGGYTQGVAISSNDEIDGKFTQLEPLFRDTGGHGMIFEKFDVSLCMTLHSPNETPDERPFFYDIAEVGDRLTACDK